jgi:diguanylate cyclase (GGDEF)-like protein
LHVIAATLQDNYKVSVTKTLTKAYELLEQYRYDILLLDINLPDGNGFDLCRHVLQKNNLQQDIRIIFMSGLTSTNDELKGLEIGAADYVRKPLHSALLFARVRLQAQLLRRNELLANLARIDALTEIPNRRAFDDHLSLEWGRARRENSLMTLGIIDIDHFKAFNDTYGHPEGDKCLQSVAHILRRTFQRGSDFVARYGGEEFAVILSNTGLETARNLFETALLELKQLKIEHSGSTTKSFVTFSAGVCCTKPENKTAEELFQLADQQLYRAKGKGRAQICADNV